MDRPKYDISSATATLPARKILAEVKYVPNNLAVPGFCVHTHCAAYNFGFLARQFTYFQRFDKDRRLLFFGVFAFSCPYFPTARPYKCKRNMDANTLLYIVTGGIALIVAGIAISPLSPTYGNTAWMPRWMRPDVGYLERGHNYGYPGELAQAPFSWLLMFTGVSFLANSITADSGIADKAADELFRKECLESDRRTGKRSYIKC